MTGNHSHKEVSRKRAPHLVLTVRGRTVLGVPYPDDDVRGAEVEVGVFGDVVHTDVLLLPDHLEFTRRLARLPFRTPVYYQDTADQVTRKQSLCRSLSVYPILASIENISAHQ